MSTGSNTAPLRFDCEETVRRLWGYLDGRLDEATVEAIDRHLAECEKCPPHFATERRLLEVMREARREALAPASLRARVMAALALAARTPAPDAGC